MRCCIKLKCYVVVQRCIKQLRATDLQKLATLYTLWCNKCCIKCETCCIFVKMLHIYVYAMLHSYVYVTQNCETMYPLGCNICCIYMQQSLQIHATSNKKVQHPFTFLLTFIYIGNLSCAYFTYKRITMSCCIMVYT